MEKEIKELVVILLKAIILDGKAGIDNAVQDKDLDRLEFEYSKIDYAVREIINLTENEECFSYYMLGKMLRKVNPNAKDMESNIKSFLRLDFTNDEINELAGLMTK